MKNPKCYLCGADTKIVDGRTFCPNCGFLDEVSDEPGEREYIR